MSQRTTSVRPSRAAFMSAVWPCSSSASMSAPASASASSRVTSPARTAAFQSSVMSAVYCARHQDSVRQKHSGADDLRHPPRLASCYLLLVTCYLLSAAARRAAVRALVAGARAHHDRAARRAGRRIFLVLNRRELIGRRLRGRDGLKPVAHTRACFGGGGDIQHELG